MTRLTVLSFGSKLEPFESEWIEVFVTRLKRYSKIEWHRIDSKKIRTDSDVIREIKKYTTAQTQIVLLDEAGKSFSTDTFRRWIDKQENQSVSHFCFVVGEAYGFSKEILETFPFHLSLSPLTFAHRLALLVLFEQLYRVFSLKAGSPYHHE